MFSMRVPTHVLNYNWGVIISPNVVSLLFFISLAGNAFSVQLKLTCYGGNVQGLMLCEDFDPSCCMNVIDIVLLLNDVHNPECLLVPVTCIVIQSYCQGMQIISNGKQLDSSNIGET